MRLGLKIFYKISLALSVIGVIVLVFDFGFAQSTILQSILNGYFIWVLVVGILATLVRYFDRWGNFTKGVLVFDVVSVGLISGILYFHFQHSHPQLVYPTLYNDIWIKLAVLLTFIREFSDLNLNYKRKLLNPAQLFIISFFVIIKLGTWLLLLPKATTGGIAYIDAFFTATSAVCVTGLAVVDTGTYFTTFGQVIIMLLIQIGGLGILTFASYFSYFFKGGSTYENQLVWGDITSSKKLSDVFSTLKYILVITFTIELISGLFIYFNTGGLTFSSEGRRIFFAAFHAVSAFCNAGFSTLPNNLAGEAVRHNYSLHTIIMLTLVLGGLGFPIVSNILKYTKYRIIKLIPFAKNQGKYKPWILNLHSRIILITTALLIIMGFLAFYILEYNNVLTGYSGIGKIVTSFFGITTPRTAGFSTIDNTALRTPTLLVVLFLMWVGASPQSTGGGIKTSTFAVATLNIVALARGKSRIEVFRREIADISVRRASATISLSLIVIGFGTLALSISEPSLGLMSLLYECISAFSTVGLSLGITEGLSGMSKFILITIMFIGRVSMLSIMIAVFEKIKRKNYRYPTEEITIN